MDTSHYEIQSPTDEEQAALEEWAKTGAADGAVDMHHYLETRDAPPLVLAFFERSVAYARQWYDDEFAKNRPITRDPVGARFRLFDGPWLGPYDVPSVIEALFEVGKDDAGKPLFESRVEPVFTCYEQLIEAGDETGCRRLAAAIYEWHELRARGDRLIVETCRELRVKTAS